MNNSTDNICVDCGLCCDGTMFGQVINDDAESLIQPCKYLCGHCTIYEDRPVACQDFKCALLYNHEDGNVTTQDAQEIIRNVKAKLEPLYDLYEDLTFYQITYHAFHRDGDMKWDVLNVALDIEHNFKEFDVP